MDAEQTLVELIQVPWADARAEQLRRVMDAEMTVRYRPEPGQPAESAELLAKRDAALAVEPSEVVATLLALDDDGSAIGHAALRRLGDEWEVKRVIVTAPARGRGVGRALMTELERIGRDHGAQRLILQTGDKQPEAIALYERLGWTPIPIYEPYAETMPFSRCYELVLR